MATRYRIDVRGPIPDRAAEEFPELEFHPRGAVTTMVGVLPDDAALYGVIARIESLGLALTAITTSDPTSPGPCAGDNTEDGETT